jgi:branched-chain amino acid transport system permease protein
MTHNRAKLLGAIALLLVALAVVPIALRDSPYLVHVLINAVVLSIIAGGVWVTFAIGRINISQGAFAMIGGYVTAILSTRYGVSFWICPPQVLDKRRAKRRRFASDFKAKSSASAGGGPHVSG